MKKTPLIFWNENKFESTSYTYNLEERKNLSYVSVDKITKKSCRYTFNELGFRGDSIIKKGFRIMTLGCSMTEGVGVDDNETWSHIFSKLIPNSVDINLGLGGRSNDFMCRSLLTLYEVIKPNLVIILYTGINRREYYDENYGLSPFIASNPIGYFFRETEKGKKIQKDLTMVTNENEDLINWYKNHLLIKYFLQSKNCNWLWDNSFIDCDYKDDNLFHKGYTNGVDLFKVGFKNVFIDKGTDDIHPGKLHQETYAKNLYNYIKNNHGDYLNTNFLETEKKSLI